MRAVAKSAEAISAGDVINTSVRRYMNWSLMPAFNTLAMPCAGGVHARREGTPSGQATTTLSLHLMAGQLLNLKSKNAAGRTHRHHGFQRPHGF
eukprot:gene29740-biopygen4370